MSDSVGLTASTPYQCQHEHFATQEAFGSFVGHDVEAGGLPIAVSMPIPMEASPMAVPLAMRRELNDWVDAAPDGEITHRQAVRSLILDAFLNNTTTLDLKDYTLSTLPESIGQLKSLIHLNLYGMQLTALPESIGQLTNLITLSCHFNKLTTFPESIGQLISLENLYANNNQLMSLPTSIKNLRVLKNFFINQNQVHTLPKSVFQLPRNCTVSLQGNPLSEDSQTQLFLRTDIEGYTGPTLHFDWAVQGHIRAKTVPCLRD